MEIKVNFNGAEVPVSLTEEQEKELRRNYLSDFMNEYISACAEKYAYDQYSYTSLTEEELDTIKEILIEYPYEINAQYDMDNYDDCHMEGVSSKCNALVLSLINGSLRKEVEEVTMQVLDSRVKYYTFTIPYSGELEVVVKAHNEDEAIDYVCDMGAYDLVEIIEPYDMDFDAPELCNESDCAPSCTEVLDATE